MKILYLSNNRGAISNGIDIIINQSSMEVKQPSALTDYVLIFNEEKLEELLNIFK